MSAADVHIVKLLNDSFYFKALLTFHEQYQRAPTQDVDIPNLMKIIRDKTSSSTASASSSNNINNDEFNEELLK
jgi:hypothetical protein